MKICIRNHIFCLFGLLLGESAAKIAADLKFDKPSIKTPFSSGLQRVWKTTIKNKTFVISFFDGRLFIRTSKNSDALKPLKNLASWPAGRLQSSRQVFRWMGVFFGNQFALKMTMQTDIFFANCPVCFQSAKKRCDLKKHPLFFWYVRNSNHYEKKRKKFATDINVDTKFHYFEKYCFWCFGACIWESQHNRGILKILPCIFNILC